jgi:hypothetical protein
MKRIKTIILAQLALLGILLCISAPAWANLAANTQIINSADLSYWDGSKTAHATASVTVTVNMVPGAPTLAAGLPQTTSYNGCGTTLTDSFTITAGSNGPDTYNLSAAVVVGPGTQNSTSPTAVPTPTTTVFLGATVTTTGVGSPDASHITVPYDGTNDGIVNGIAVGATVVIGGTQEKTVTAITEYPRSLPSVPIAYAVITLNSPLSGVPGAGVLVAEKKTIQTLVTSGCIVTSGTDVTVTDTITATSGSGTGPATTSGSVLNTYTSGIATLTKYVRNVSVPSGTGTPYIYGGNNYYLAGVTAKPGEVLEYALIATNTSTTGSVSAAVVTDAIPTSYVTLKTGMYTGGKDITYIDETPIVHYLTVNAVGSAATYAAPTLTVNVGGASPATPPAAGGTIPATKSVVVLYQVTLNP